MSENENIYLKRVLENAFDFLETAINQLEEKPKYSVINFCSAVELILKARLLHEHWALIVLGEPNINEFKSGKSKTLNFKNLVPRINNITNENISNQIKICFESIADHRNKYIHFFHEAHTPEASKDIRRKIALEQHTAWDYLKELFNKWDFIFNPYNQTIQRLDISMRGQKRQAYLDEKFEEVKDEIEEDKRNGAVFKDCESCKFPASKEKQLTDKLFVYKCKVCNREEPIIRIECPNEECGALIEITEYTIEQDIFECEHCGEEISKKQVINILDTDPVTTDNYFERPPINCSNCSGTDTVIKYHEYYLCTNCLYLDNEIEYCGWCGEGQLGGNLEDSFHYGCEMCDGHDGWHCQAPIL